jgi:phosphopantothenoylcysteine decarboxylase/phosphopantothenate--cysteine ligase
MEHISLADKADLFLIVPATANIIGKIANGIADDLLSTSVMATHAPVIICPAMNCKMLDNPIVRQNIQKLKQLGYQFIDAEQGMLACGYKGKGRLANINKIAKESIELIKTKDKLKGKKIIVTAGPTQEPIDPVRVITNKSSGKMGIYIAEEAAKLGADVTLIRGKTDIEPNQNIKDIKIGSVNELFNKIKKEIKNNNIIIHAAAVSDFSLKEKIDKKIKSGKELHLELTPTTKIFEKIKKIKKDITLVGFKAEYKVSEKELVKRAYGLLKKAKADFIVANDVGNDVFGSETNNVRVINRSGKIKKFKGTKREIAKNILDIIK